MHNSEPHRPLTWLLVNQASGSNDPARVTGTVEERFEFAQCEVVFLCAAGQR